MWLLFWHDLGRTSPTSPLRTERATQHATEGATLRVPRPHFKKGSKFIFISLPMHPGDVFYAPESLPTPNPTRSGRPTTRRGRPTTRGRHRHCCEIPRGISPSQASWHLQSWTQHRTFSSQVRLDRVNTRMWTAPICEDPKFRRPSKWLSPLPSLFGGFYIKYAPRCDTCHPHCRDLHHCRWSSTAEKSMIQMLSSSTLKEKERSPDVTSCPLLCSFPVRLCSGTGNPNQTPG